MKFEDMYFHLSDKYKVIGKLSSKEMDEVTNGILKKSGALDSLMNSIEIPND